MYIKRKREIIEKKQIKTIHTGYKYLSQLNHDCNLCGKHGQTLQISYKEILFKDIYDDVTRYHSIDLYIDICMKCLRRFLNKEKLTFFINEFYERGLI